MTREYGIALAGPTSTRIVSVDPSALSRILANLLHNSLRFTPMGGEVAVTIHDVPGKDVIVAVDDTDTGIPAEARGRLFQRFTMPGVPSHGRKGSGLGL